MCSNANTFKFGYFRIAALFLLLGGTGCSSPPADRSRLQSAQVGTAFGATSDDTPLQNFALNAPASQSSLAFGGLPERANDGNTDGNFYGASVSHTDFDIDPWWQVDLGQSVAIDSIVLWGRSDCCSDRLSNIDIFVSDVPFASTDRTATTQQTGVVARFFDGQATLPSQAVSVAAIGRYVRVQLSTQQVLSLAEVQVWGRITPATIDGGADLSSGLDLSGRADLASAPPADMATPSADLARPADLAATADLAASGLPYPDMSVSLPDLATLDMCVPDAGADIGAPETDYAQSGTATQSSTVLGADPSRAIDGNTDGVFVDGSVSHTDENDQSWWEVDLGRTVSINHVDIWGRSDCCTSRLSNFYVLISNEPFQSSRVQEAMSQPGVVAQLVTGPATIPEQVVDIGGVAGRYVRIQLWGQEYLSLAEVQVFGSTSLFTACSADSDCSATDFCDHSQPAGATCQTATPHPVGELCASPRQCRSGFCVNGGCCDQACEGTGASCVTGTCVKPPTFTVTVQDATDPIPFIQEMFTSGYLQFNATITNNTAEAQVFDLFDLGNIRVVTIEKDGAPLAGTSRQYLWDPAPALDRMAKLTSIPSHGTGSFVIEQLLSSEQGSTADLIDYPASPGKYRLVFAYQYRGPGANGNSAFGGEMISNEVVFNVQ